jgi:hypothetical protein
MGAGHELELHVVNRESTSVRELASLESIRGRPQDEPVTRCLRDGDDRERSAITGVVEKNSNRTDRLAFLYQESERFPKDRNIGRDIRQSGPYIIE